MYSQTARGLHSAKSIGDEALLAPLVQRPGNTNYSNAMGRIAAAIRLEVAAVPVVVFMYEPTVPHLQLCIPSFLK
jgi:hypothetical protein